MDASLALPSTGSHLFCLNDGQRYIVRRLLDYAHREEQYAVQWNADGTYTTPSAAQLDGIFENVDSLEDELMSTLTYEEGSVEVALIPQSTGLISLNPSYNSLAYIKIGRLVTLSGRLLVALTNTPLGRLKLDGLPFLSEPLGVGYCVIPFIGSYLLSGAVQALHGIVLVGTQYAFLDRYSSGSIIPDLAQFIQAGTALIIGGHYFAAA
jgi:hypothetical protein